MLRLKDLWSHRRRTAGAMLVVTGLLVLGLWKFIGAVVPVMLLIAAVVLAWRRSVLGVVATVAGAVLLFYLGLTLAWTFVVVGAALVIGGGALLMMGGGKLVEEASKET